MLTMEPGRKDVLGPETGPGTEGLPDQLDYETVMDHLEEFGQPIIQSSYYFIRPGREDLNLYRLSIVGNLYSCETVDHDSFGITDDDLEYAVSSSGEDFPYEGYYPISVVIIRKLEALLD
jgi:hypothetical protein